MKKRIIWLAVILVLLGLLATAFIVSDFRAALRNSAICKDVYAWLRDNFYGWYKALRYGPRRFAIVAIILSGIFALLSFGLLKVPAVDDSTMKPITVTQKPTVFKTNGKTSMVIIEETEGGN